MVKTLSELKHEAKEKYHSQGIDVDKSGTVICAICTFKINFTKKNGKDTVKKHVESGSHKRMKTVGKKQSLIMQSLENMNEKSDDYDNF